jgi:hypothetical protein
MNKEFVPYQEALELKELGFDEPCFGFYGGLSPLNDRYDYSSAGYNYNHQITSGSSFHCTKILYQQAFRWFREKHNLRIRNYVFANMSGGISEGFEIFKYAKDTIDRVESLSYEEAELACLRKLIELVKK